MLAPIVTGQRRGTHFTAAARSLAACRSGFGFGKPAKARLTWTKARGAASPRRQSLLAVGVCAVTGTSRPGDAVELVAPTASRSRRGWRRGSAELARKPRGVEAIHRDRLVLYE